MNKNSIVLAGIIISLLAIVSIFLNNEVDVKNNNSKKEKQNISQNNEIVDQIAIDYKVTQQEQDSQKEIDKIPIPKIEKYLEAKTYDKSRSFEIALINPNQDLRKTESSFTSLQGKIDGELFFLKVPKKLIEEGSGNTQLRIKNLKTNEEVSMPASFIDDMRDPKMKQMISIDSTDIQNYEQKTIEQIVPLRPGESRD